jgi:hypothetical protein
LLQLRKVGLCTRLVVNFKSHLVSDIEQDGEHDTDHHGPVLLDISGWFDVIYCISITHLTSTTKQQ